MPICIAARFYYMAKQQILFDQNSQVLSPSQAGRLTGAPCRQSAHNPEVSGVGSLSCNPNPALFVRKRDRYGQLQIGLGGMA